MSLFSAIIVSDVSGPKWVVLVKSGVLTKILPGSNESSKECFLYQIYEKLDSQNLPYLF